MPARAAAILAVRSVHWVAAMSQPDGSEIEPLPENLLREPLDFLFADHCRQRALCDRLRRIASHPPGLRGRAVVRQALAFLERDLPLHHRDEECDLFPLLRRRCLPGDNLLDMLEILSAEHAASELAAASIAGHLRLILTDPVAVQAGLTAAVELFAAMQHRHLIWENVVVLPLARHRLKPTDLARMGRMMAERRHVQLPE